MSFLIPWISIRFNVDLIRNDKLDNLAHPVGEQGLRLSIRSIGAVLLQIDQDVHIDRRYQAIRRCRCEEVQ